MGTAARAPVIAQPGGQQQQPQPARCAAVFISAPASGQGKTTVTAALARLHARRGLAVRVFKCGPDFLDPHWLALASGAPVHALDLWITGAADCAQRLHAAARSADLILIEGAMGLFDGKPCGADLAQRFGLPVLAVIDAAAMAGSFGAIAFGLQHYRPGLRWAGVLANRVAGARHGAMLAAGLHAGGHWMGALMQLSCDAASASANPGAALWPERHLGLQPAHELPDAMARLDAAANALAATPLGRMTAPELARCWGVDFAAPAAAAAPPALLAGRSVAVARDAAFCFIYAANLQTLEAMGARLRFFSPLGDCALPGRDCDAVWLPGGYPELHCAQLAANTGMQASLRAHLAAGRALWAECGGMLALFESITLTDGSTVPLWGLLPGRARMHRRLVAIGPQQLTLAGHTLRGHSFHHSSCTSSATVLARSTRPGAAQPEPAADSAAAGAADPARATACSGAALYRHGSLYASYFHAWFASSPQALARLLGAAGA